MSALRNRRNWGMTVRALAVSVGANTAAGVWAAAPAHADITSDLFLSSLNNAGVGYNDPANAVELGQSICPMLSQPGGSFARAASSIANNGISPDMASLFTSIAISMYCPSMVSSFANGDWLNNGDWLTSGNLPGLGFGIPGLPTQ
jgi:Protein of unknown function (DUF732)